VWVPLFISLIVLSLLFLLHSPIAAPSWLLDIHGHDRSSEERSTSHLSWSSTRYAADKVVPEDISTGKAVSIRYKDLCLTTGHTARLNNISGHIPSCKFTAIIGGSGAGKTSLMNVLLGREDPSSGTVDFVTEVGVERGQAVEIPLPATYLRDHVGFVPQADVLVKSLTVDQVLLHSARTRLPASLSSDQRRHVVDSVLTQLGISHLKHVVVGGSGVSAGNRKKINMAVGKSKYLMT
jgi:ABC-type lipoprotein export system ATPase subunit